MPSMIVRRFAQAKVMGIHLQFRCREKLNFILRAKNNRKIYAHQLDTVYVTHSFQNSQLILEALENFICFAKASLPPKLLPGKFSMAQKTDYFLYMPISTTSKVSNRFIWDGIVTTKMSMLPLLLHFQSSSKNHRLRVNEATSY